MKTGRSPPFARARRSRVGERIVEVGERRLVTLPPISASGRLPRRDQSRIEHVGANDVLHASRDAARGAATAGIKGSQTSLRR